MPVISTKVVEFIVCLFFLTVCITCKILPAFAVVAIVPSASPGNVRVLSAAGLELGAANITQLPPLCNNLI